MGSLIFDGHDFGELFAYGDPTINILASTVGYAESSSRNGSTVTGRRWGSSSVSLRLGVHGSALKRRNAFSMLGAWLDVDEPKKLVLPDTPDRYYMAIPDGGVELTRGIRGEIGTLAFTITDPIAYGEEKAVTVPSGGSVTFVVGGTYPTLPRLSGRVTPNSTKTWGVRLDEGDFFHIDSASTAAFDLTADFGKRTSTINAALALPTLSSTWFELSPGEHTLRNDVGSGAVTVAYDERWL